MLEDNEESAADLEEDLEDIDDDEEGDLPSDDEDEEDGDEDALEEILAQRPGARRAEEDQDEDDIMSLVPEPELPKNVDPPPAKLTPVKAHEFVCNSCRLVKKRSQLADKDRMLCRDCV